MLSDLHIKFLTEARGLSLETLDRFGIRSGRRTDQGVIDDQLGNVLIFPYTDSGKIVNEKYRGPQKKFWQWPNNTPGKKATFFHADAIDAVLETGEPLVITEGEIDCMTAAEAGYHAVSVPDGAPSTELREDLPRMSFLWNNRQRLKGVKWFILAVDADEPGQRLAEELCRVLSPGRCMKVSYPDGCKDLNEVLVKFDGLAVHRVLHAATPYPVKGLYRLSDYPEGAQIDPKSTGWPALDAHFKPFRGGVTVITGIPSHGKSSFALNLLVNLAETYSWRSAIFSPEMPVEFLRRSFVRVIGGPREAALAFAQEHFVFIGADPKGEDEDEDFTVEFILDKATEAIMRDSVNCLLIDPWNEMDAARRHGESMSDYIGRALRAIKRFARQRKVAVIILAHPSKAVWSEGKTRAPTLYDIADSAHFYNKCDHGIVIWRDPTTDGIADISVIKSRFRDAGERGDVKMMFHKDTETFETLSQAMPDRGTISDD